MTDQLSSPDAMAQPTVPPVAPAGVVIDSRSSVTQPDASSTEPSAVPNPVDVQAELDGATVES